MSKTTFTTAVEMAETYRRAGWPTPFPVAAGEKFPPVTGCTGEAPSVEEADRNAEAAWNEIPNGEARNMGLRMPADVIALDVDDYEKKHGAAALAELTEKLGALPPTYSSTRRGAESPARQLFFRVPAGVKWSSVAGPGIDILQHTHRYAVVWPSVVDGDMYRWYDVDGNVMPEGEIPNVEDLAELPAVWVDALKRGEVTGAPRPELSLSRPAALKWLAENVRNAEGPTTGRLALTEWTSGALADRFNPDNCGSRHDEMVSLTRVMIRTALETDAEGLLSLLERTRTAFYGAYTVKPGEHDRRPDPAEFDRAVHGEVEKIRGEVEAGLFRPFAVLAASVTGLSPEVFTALRSDRPADLPAVDALETVRRRFYGYRGDDLPARLLLDLCGDLQLWKADVTTKHGDLSLYDVEEGHTVRTVPTFRPYLRRFVAPVVEALKASLPDPDTLPDAEKAEAEFLTKECARVLKACHYERDAAPVLSAVVGLLNEAGKPLLESKADGDDVEHLLGLSDGSVIDLSLWGDGASLPESVRPRRRDEILTKSLNLSGAEIAHYSAELERMADAGETPEAAELFRTVFGEATTTALECMAYSLHGSNPHRLIWGVMGATGTGKSTVMGFLEQTLGDYGVPVAMEELCKRGGTNSEKVAALRARAAFMSEFSQDVRGYRDALKEIASNEKVAAAAKFANTEYHRGTVLTFSTNEPARVDFDDALEDRFVVVPVACTQEEFRRVRARVTDLWSVAPLNRVWLLSVLADNFRVPWVEGFQRSRLPESVRRTSARFVAESNPAHGFVAEALEFTGDPADAVAQSDLLDAVEDYTGVALKVAELKKIMEDNGAEKTRKRFSGPRYGANPVAAYAGVKFRLSASDVAA